MNLTRWLDSLGSLRSVRISSLHQAPAVPPWEAGGLYFTTGNCGHRFSTRCQSPITQGEVSSKATAQSLLGNRVQMLPARDPSLHPINLRSLITSLVILSQMSSPLLTYSFTDSHLHTSLCLFIPYLLFFPPIIFLLSQSLLVSSDTAIPLVALSCFYSPNLFHCKSTSPNL